MPSQQTPDPSPQLFLDLDASTSPEPGATTGTPGSPGWAPTDLWVASPGAIDPLLIACELNHTDLIDALLALPNAWSLSAVEPQGRCVAGVTASDVGKSALHLILRARNANSASSENSAAQAQRQALEMARRGFDILALDASRQSPLSMAALNGREGFICGLKGHPDFTYDKIKHLRVGSQLGEAPAIDPRDSLIGHLARSGRLEALKALVAHAAWPINELDCAGRRALGYATTAHMTEALLRLGADPSLVDADGKTPTTRAQAISNTQDRDKMTGLIATALRKGAAKSDPAMMAQLQAENLPALLKAAFSAPKSSMLKIISAFGFSVSSARDPASGITPLMCAFRGGRLSSAIHLMGAGCNLNEQDNSGLSAAGYLLLGEAASGSGHGGADELYKKLREGIDWTLTDKRGFPTAFHPFLIPNKISSGNANIALERAIAAGADFKAPLIGPNGETLVGAYAKALSRAQDDWSLFRNLTLAVAKTLSLNQPQGVDDILEVALQKAPPAELQRSYSPRNAKDVFEAVTSSLSAPGMNADLLVNSTAFFEAAPQELRSALAQHAPAIHSLLESCALRSLNAPGKELKAKAGPRL